MKAYPFLHKHPTTGETTLGQGMDLRDYFAGQALPKLMGTAPINAAVESAYRWADAMMKARENKHE
jgi:hypothetical protein